MPIQARKKTIIPRQRVKTSLHWNISPRGRTAFPVAANFAKKSVTLWVAARHRLVPRQARCRELNVCTLCTSTRHKTKDCLGKQNRLPFKCSLCNSRNHVTPLCDKAEKKKNSALSINVCNSSRTLNQPFILPMVSLSVSKGRQKHNVNCLLDTGSQRSYFSKVVAEKLKCKKHSFTPGDYEVSTFFGTRKKRLEEVVLGIHVDKDWTFHLPVLVDKDFDINLKTDHFSEVKKNLNNLKYKLAFTDNGSDQVCIHGLIGVNIIQFMDMKTIKCMNGIAWEFSTGIVPLGNSHHFLYQKQSAQARAMKSAPENNYQTIITGYSSCPKERVNFIFKPQKNLSGCVFRMFKWKNSRCKICEKKKKKKNLIQITGTIEEYDYPFWTIIKIAILMAFSSGGNV